MTPEAEPYFQRANYKRYPHIGKFLVTERSGEQRNIALWHNGQAGTPEQPRFFEENSPTWKMLVDDRIKISRDNYDELLVEGLTIPAQEIDRNYGAEKIIYIATSGHNMTVEKTRQYLSPEKQHRRIRRQSGEPVIIAERIRNYRNTVKALDNAGLIYAKDFSHWNTQPPFGAGEALITRINMPRR